MPVFDTDSEEKILTCHSKIQVVVREVIKVIDFKVIWGHRNKEQQNQAYNGGFSEKPWPLSKHNSFPSLAIDLAPHPINWNNINRFALLGGYFMATADYMGIKLRAGFDWDQDWDITDQSFMDWGHFELPWPEEE